MADDVGLAPEPARDVLAMDVSVERSELDRRERRERRRRRADSEARVGTAEQRDRAPAVEVEVVDDAREPLALAQAC